jgi:hypothetical protein
MGAACPRRRGVLLQSVCFLLCRVRLPLRHCCPALPLHGLRPRGGSDAPGHVACTHGMHRGRGSVRACHAQKFSTLLLITGPRGEQLQLAAGPAAARRGWHAPAAPPGLRSRAVNGVRAGSRSGAVSGQALATGGVQVRGARLPEGAAMARAAHAAQCPKPRRCPAVDPRRLAAQRQCDKRAKWARRTLRNVGCRLSPSPRSRACQKLGFLGCPPPIRTCPAARTVTSASRPAWQAFVSTLRNGGPGLLPKWLLGDRPKKGASVPVLAEAQHCSAPSRRSLRALSATPALPRGKVGFEDPGLAHQWPC